MAPVLTRKLTELNSSRGEGVAAVILKRMTTAIANGDQIIGCIAATEVRQNLNCTPIVVPNAPSLSTLFNSVLNKAGLKPEDISVVEAHGIGTQVVRRSS